MIPATVISSPDAHQVRNVTKLFVAPTIKWAWKMFEQLVVTCELTTMVGKDALRGTTGTANG